jgi:hypothetical protein
MWCSFPNDGGKPSSGRRVGNWVRSSTRWQSTVWLSNEHEGSRDWVAVAVLHKTADATRQSGLNGAQGDQYSSEQNLPETDRSFLRIDSV